MADYFNVLHKKEKEAAPPAVQQKRKFVPSALRGSQKPALPAQQSAVGRSVGAEGVPLPAACDASTSQADPPPPTAVGGVQGDAQPSAPAASQARVPAAAVEQSAAVSLPAPTSAPLSHTKPAQPTPGPGPGLQTQSAALLHTSREGVASPLPDGQTQADMTEGPRGAVASPPTPFLPAPPAPSLVPLGAQDQPPRDTRASAHARAGTAAVTAAGRKKGEENSDPAGKPKRQSGRGQGRTPLKRLKDRPELEAVIENPGDLTLGAIIRNIAAKEKDLEKEAKRLKEEATRLVLERGEGGATEGSQTPALPAPPPHRRISKEAPQGPVVQLRLGDDGNLMLEDTPAMVGNDDEEEGRAVAGDPVCHNSSSFTTKGVAKLWNAHETALFYKAFRLWGIDFATMALCFPGRDRKQLRNKYKNEKSRNPGMMDALEDLHLHGDRSQYANSLKQVAEAVKEHNVLDPSERAQIDAPAAEVLEAVEIPDMLQLPDTPANGRKRKCGTASSPESSAKGRRISAPQPEIAGYLELPSWGEGNKGPRRATTARLNPKAIPHSDSDSEWEGEPEEATPLPEPLREGLRPRSTRAAARLRAIIVDD